MTPPIKTVVILMMENQSYDRAMSWRETPGGGPPPAQPDYTLTARADRAWIWNGAAPTALPGGRAAVRRQLVKSPHAATKVMQSGFVKAPGAEPPAPGSSMWEPRHPDVMLDSLTRSGVQKLLGRSVLSPIDEETRALARAILEQSWAVLRREDVPTYGFLSDEFTVCDNWFATHLSHTHPNRSAFLHDRPSYDLPDIASDTDWVLFDECEAAGTRVNVVVDDVLSALWLDAPRWAVKASFWDRDFPRRYRHDGASVAGQSEMLRDTVQAAPAGQRQLIWVEPNHQGAADARSNDLNHAHIWNGQKLVHDVYESILAANGFKDTLLIVCYDEHGGWHDHVTPPASPWASVAGLDPWARVMGGRTPAFLVSPWIKKGFTLPSQLDATAITALLVELGFLRPHPNGLSSFHDAHAFDDAWRAAPRATMPTSVDPWAGWSHADVQKELNASRTFRSYSPTLPAVVAADADTESWLNSAVEARLHHLHPI